MTPDDTALRAFGAEVQRLIDRQDLTRERTYELFRQVLLGEQPDLQQGALLAALVAKGETPEEIAGAWQAIVEFDTVPAALASLDAARARGPLVENSGTGMDTLKTFNVSSAAAIIAAAKGARLARHGARALTSRCGAVDILEAVGVDVDCDAATVERSIDVAGIGIFNGMSPAVHPGGLGRILSQIRFGSTLNIAASLANPVRPTHGVRGVYADGMLGPVGDVMMEIGYEHALVVHGYDDRREGGMDEFSVLGTTVVSELRADGSRDAYTVEPEDFGMRRARHDEIAPLDELRDEAVRFVQVLGGRGHEACGDAACLNAAAVLYVAGRAVDLTRWARAGARGRGERRGPRQARGVGGSAGRRRRAAGGRRGPPLGASRGGGPAGLRRAAGPGPSPGPALRARAAAAWLTGRPAGTTIERGRRPRLVTGVARPQPSRRGDHGTPVVRRARLRSRLPVGRRPHGRARGPCRRPRRGPGWRPSGTWTIALYVNADNDLEYTWPRFTLPALQRIPVSPKVNVVALLDKESKTGSYLYRVRGSQVTTVRHWATERDFGKGETFQWFLQQVHSRFPSDHLIVVGWDHGYGWRYFSHDYNADDTITMPELRAALAGAGVPVDILAFDACNMGDVEVAWDVASVEDPAAPGTPLVKYLVASEETIDQDGYPYDTMFAPLAADPGRSPVQVTDDMLRGWDTYYGSLRCFDWCSLSAVDLAAVRAAGPAMADLAGRLSSGLAASPPEYGYGDRPGRPLEPRRLGQLAAGPRHVRRAHRRRPRLRLRPGPGRGGAGGA